MKKSEIKVHCGHGRCYPCVNIKVYEYAKGLTAQDLSCSEEVFEKALEYAFEAGQESFWDSITDYVKYIWSHGTACSAGRSGGYAVVMNLSPIESWDAIAVSRWARFVNVCKLEIKCLCSKEYVKDIIETNKWNKPYAERYNFYEHKDGHSECIADMKAKAIALGFGPVIRK